MRKATIRIGEKIIEIGVSEEEAKELLALSHSQHKNELKTTSLQIDHVQHRKKREFQIPSTWQLLVETETEMRGRKEQNAYALYRDKTDGRLYGLVKSNNTLANLGTPDDPSSIIAHIIRVTKSMPMEFTRNKLREALPYNVARGHYVKFALDYMEYMHMVEKLSQRDIVTGALKYKRLTSAESQDRNTVKVSSEWQSDR